MKKITDFIVQGNRYYIYGTAEMGRYCCKKAVEEFGDNIIIGFIETTVRKRTCYGKKVYALDSVDLSEKNVYVLIASVSFSSELEANLLERSFPKERIIRMDDWRPFFYTLPTEQFISGRTLAFWPPLRKDCEDVVKKISWFVPDKCKVYVWLCEDVSYQFNENVRITALENQKDCFESADYICVWDIHCTDSFLNNWMNKMLVVDSTHFIYIDTPNYSKLYYNLFTIQEKETLRRQSQKNFSDLIKKVRSKHWNQANVFCTGPSIQEVLQMEFKGQFNLITNSMVKDKAFLEQIEPSLLVFTDENFYISPTRYCHRFYEDVLDAIKKYDLFIAVWEYEVPLIIKHYPTLQSRILGISNRASDFVFPSVNQMELMGTGNILTEMLLPFASALCGEVNIAGCTGRNPDETYYWKHNDRTQYLDLMQSVFDMWPSIFREQKYEEYYENHCYTVEKLLEYGEARGIRYRNITTSYIPALKKRSYKENNDECR